MNCIHFYSSVYLHVRPVIEQVQKGSQSINILSTQEAAGWVGHEDRACVDTTPSPPGRGGTLPNKMMDAYSQHIFIAFITLICPPHSSRFRKHSHFKK